MVDGGSSLELLTFLIYALFSGSVFMTSYLFSNVMLQSPLLNFSVWQDLKYQKEAFLAFHFKCSTNLLFVLSFYVLYPPLFLFGLWLSVAGTSDSFKTFFFTEQLTNLLEILKLLNDSRNKQKYNLFCQNFFSLFTITLSPAEIYLKIKRTKYFSSKRSKKLALVVVNFHTNILGNSKKYKQNLKLFSEPSRESSAQVWSEGRSLRGYMCIFGKKKGLL